MTAKGRTTIILDGWQLDTLRAQAEQRGRTLSEIIREILSAHLADATARSTRRRAALDALDGIIKNQRSRGKDHDKVLYGLDRRGRERP